MIRDWKQHPLVVAGLFATAVVVWGVFLLRVQADQTSDVPSRAVGLEMDLGIERPPDEPAFVEVTHDPFSPLDLAVDEPEITRSEARESPRAATPLRHRLHGIIGGTALLADPAGAIHVVRRGEAIDGFEILGVHASHIEIHMDGRLSELVLE